MIHLTMVWIMKVRILCRYEYEFFDLSKEFLLNCLEYFDIINLTKMMMFATGITRIDNKSFLMIEPFTMY
jgi:hypothetical protein